MTPERRRKNGGNGSLRCGRITASLQKLIKRKLRRRSSSRALTAIGPEARIRRVLESLGYREERYYYRAFRQLLQSEKEYSVRALSFDCYVTTLLQIADKCAFDAITPDDLLDRIIFGIGDSKVRERRLREPELNHTKTLDICRASEMFQAQIKVVSEFSSPNVHLLIGEVSQTDRSLLQINFVLVGSTKVNARPAPLGASSVENPFFYLQ